MVEEKPIDTGKTLALIDEPDSETPPPETNQAENIQPESAAVAVNAEPAETTSAFTASTIASATSSTSNSPASNNSDTESESSPVTTTPVTLTQANPTPETSQETEPAVPAEDPPAATAEPTTDDNEIANLESANWILVQEQTQYTVQMSASRDRASVAYFLERTQLSPPNSIYSYQRNNETWYALVHGLFPTITAAREAIEVMPQNAKTNQPWIRAVGQIQDLVKK